VPDVIELLDGLHHGVEVIAASKSARERREESRRDDQTK